MLDLIDEAEQDNEQAVLNEHDNKVTDAIARIQQLLVKTPKSEHLSADSDLELKRQLHEQLDGIELKLYVVAAATKLIVKGPKLDTVFAQSDTALH